MAELEAALAAAGYDLRRSDTGNPTLCGSRLPVRTSASIDIDRGHAWAGRVRTCVGRLTRDAAGEVVAKDLNQHRAALHLELELAPGRPPVDIYCAHLHHVNYTPTADGARAAEVTAILAHRDARRASGAAAGPAVVVGDLNQARERDFRERPGDWAVVAAALGKFDAPTDDGVAAALAAAGLQCCWDADTAARNYPGPAPPCTHWTGTTVDFVWTAGAEVAGAFVAGSGLSDHLPVVADLRLG